MADPHEDCGGLLTPLYEQDPAVLCSLGAAIDVGTFLSIKQGVFCPQQPPCRVGRLISWSWSEDDTRLLRVNLFEDIKCRPSVIGETSCSWRHMPMVKQTGEVETMMEERVLDICFVFPVAVLESLKYVAQGMRNSFVTMEDIESFPCDNHLYPQTISYSRRVWKGIETLQHLCRNLLCSNWSGHGHFVERIEIPEETWQYIVRTFSGTSGTTHVIRNGESTTRRLEVLQGMAAQETWQSYAVVSIRLFTLESIMRLVGETCVFGIQACQVNHNGELRTVDTDDELCCASAMGLDYHRGSLLVVLHYSVDLRSDDWPYRNALDSFMKGNAPPCSAHPPQPKNNGEDDESSRMRDVTLPFDWTPETEDDDSDLEGLLDVGKRFPINDTMYEVVGNTVWTVVDMESVIGCEHIEISRKEARKAAKDHYKFKQDRILDK